MNIQSLIHQHPLLFADLQNLGLNPTDVDRIAANVSIQLGGAADFNLCYVIAELSGRQFARHICVEDVAKAADISPCIAQSVVLTIAPWVDQFRLRSVQG